MKLLKISPFLMLMLFLLIGCSGGSSSSNVDSDVPSSANYNVKMLYPNGMPEGATISIDTAVNHVIDKFKDDDIDNIRYSFENIKFINDRIYYIFRRFEDKSEQIVTLGYYAVDVFTGQVFDTKGLTDLVKLD